MSNLFEKSDNNNNNNNEKINEKISLNDFLIKNKVIEDYEEFIFHSKIKISYFNNNNNNNNNFKDINFNNDYYLFIFTDKIIITKTIFNEINNNNNNINNSKNNSILFIIFYLQFISVNLISNSETSNELFIEFHSLNFQNNNEIHIKFLTISDGYFFNHFIKKNYIIEFQKVFESTILLSYKKLIYNKHFELIKYNRKNEPQKRIILITNGLIFNIKHDFLVDKNMNENNNNNINYEYFMKKLNLNKKQIKWVTAIQAIEKIVIVDKEKNEIKFYSNKIKNNAGIIEFMNETKYKKFKEMRDFEFYKKSTRNEFLALIRKNYYDLTKKYLILESE